MEPASAIPSKAPSFHDKVTIFSQFRDIVHIEMCKTDNQQLATRPFGDYVRYRFTDGQLPAEYENTGITRIWLSPDSHPVRQARQYSLTLKPFIGSGNAEDDTRVWDVFVSHPFAGSQITIPFIRNTVLESETKSNDGESIAKDVWHTEPSTEFERVLYLMFLINNSQYKMTNMENRKKRRKVKNVPKFTKSVTNSRKLAFVLQRVIRTWDRLATKYGFDGIEEMVLPYIIPTPTFDSFKPLNTRRDGYSPKDITHTFSKRISATTDARLVSKQAIERTDGVDSDFRLIAKYFLHDLHLVAESSSTYETLATSWSHGDLFPARGSTSRFEDMSGMLHRLLFNMGRDDVIDFYSETDDEDIDRHQMAGQATTTRPADATSCDEHCDCQEARTKVNAFMKSFIRPLNTSFQNIIFSDNSLRPQGTTEITGNVQLILTDPPPIVPECDYTEDCDEPCLKEDDMKEVVETITDLLRPGGHVVMFCAMEDYERWHDLFASFSYDEEDEEDPANDTSQATKVFKVDDQPLNFTFTPEQTDEDEDCRRHMRFKTSSMLAIHAMKNGISIQAANKMIRLRRFGHVHSRHPATSNVLDNVPRLKSGEIVWCTGKDGKRWIRVGQKCLALLRELICRFSLPGDIVVDLFSGTFATGIACCTILDEDGGTIRIFVGTEIDENVYNVSLPRIQNAVAGLIAGHSKRAALFGKEVNSDIIDAANLVHSHCKRRQPQSYWVPPPELPTLSILPHYMTEYILFRFQGIKGFYNQVHRQPFERWPAEIQERMQLLDMESLRALECMHCGVYVAPSQIKHIDAGLGVFANRNFSKNELIATYYGRIVYHDLSKTEYGTRSYGQGFAECNQNEFLRYSMALKVSKDCVFRDKLPKDLLNRSSDHIDIYIVPYRFSVSALINDPRYIAEDSERYGNKVRSCNVEFVQRIPYRKLKDISQLTETDAIQLVATRDIKRNQELYFDYGSDHCINLSPSHLKSKS